MSLQEDALREHRDLLREVLRMANGDLVALWQLADSEDRQVLFDWLQAGVPEIVEAYRTAAVDIGVEFYEQTQGLEASPQVVQAVALTNQQQLEASLRWAVFDRRNQEVLTAVAGIVQKHIVDGSRDYGIEAAAEAGEVWVRAAHAGACNFCRLLATRGLDDTDGYTSAETAVSVGHAGRVRKHEGRKNQPKGSSFHDNCMCVPVLRSKYNPPDYVLEWERDYRQATSAIDGSVDLYSVLSEMRQISGHRH